MTNLESMFQASFGVLAEATIKGSIVLAAAALLVLALRRASAAYRHAIWVCAFGALLALPLLLALPGWNVTSSTLTWLDPVSHPRPSPTTILSSPTAVTETPSVESTDPAPAGTPERGIAATPETEISGTASGNAAVPWQTIVMLLWAVGALAVFTAFLLGHRELRRFLRNAKPVRDGEWNTLAMEAADRLGLKMPFALLRGDGLPVPVAVGLLRSRVLLPVESDAWPLDLRRAVLLHELAHVRRHDCLTQALAQVTCAAFWFHPAVWWAASRMSVERERACDDCVLIARTRATDYADQLLGVVRSLRTRRLDAIGAVAFARRSSLEGRLLAVLDPVRDRRPIGARVAWAGTLAAALLVVPLAILEPVQAYSVRIETKGHNRHETTDPNTLRPSRVVQVPEAPASLEKRMAWARADAERSRDRALWIGWRMDVSPNLKGNLLSDTEGISLWQLDQHGLFTLGDVIEGRKEGTSGTEKSSIEETPRPTAVLIHLSGATNDRLRVQSLSLPAEFKQEPLYWMDRVPEEEMFDWLRNAAAHARDEHLRRQFVECIGFMKRSDLAVPYLRSTLESRSPDEIRAGAAEGLGHHPSGDLVKLLAEHGKTDRSYDVRRASIEALGQMQTPEALEQLLSIAHAGEAAARHAAYEVLGQKVSERAVEEASAGESEARSWKVEEDESVEEGEVNPGPPDEPSEAVPPEELETQRQAIESLGRYPEAQSLPRLRQIAESSPNGDLRAQAVESIGRLGSPAARELLERIAWKNGMEAARRSAVEGLGRNYPPEQALDRIAEIARTHPSAETRREAVEMLGRIGSPRAEQVLGEFVAKGKDVESQRQAVESLGRLGLPDVEGRLLEIARTHRSVDVQRQAVESLGRIDADVMGELAKIARTHPSSEVRHQAVESMMRRDPDQALRLIEDILRQPKEKTRS